MAREDPIAKVGDIVLTSWGPWLVERVVWVDRQGREQWLYRVEGTQCSERMLVQWQIERLEIRERERP